MKARLLLALHFHQPVGNFDSVFEEAVRLCYRPVLDAFERHRGVRAAFHLSGCLIEWLERHDRPLLDRFVALAGSGRIEPLGGGFYEPILSIIPRADALEQIDRLASWWQGRAGVRPAGAWVPERVWEPALADLLAEAGVRYTILDDQHLRFAGLLDDRFSGLFVTERCGRPVAFFPSDFRLRYLIPFRAIAAIREHLAGLPDAGAPWVLTYGDDAEKFGLWPGTHKWVHEEGWLEQFLTFLESEPDLVTADAPGRYLDERPPARRVYVPNASYTEMLEWALPPDSVRAYARVRAAALAGAPAEDVRAFVRGSLWDMFLARYPEADQIHKHMLWTSRRVRALPAGHPARERALTALLRAQCNCPYWHGLFGGLYLPHLRHGVVQSLLEADALLAEAERSGAAGVSHAAGAAGGSHAAGAAGAIRVEVADLDGDLEPEILVRGPAAQAFFRPSDGGTLTELDFLPARFNVTNVVARWKEAYHDGDEVTHAAAGTDAAAMAVASPHERRAGLSESDRARQIFDRLPLRSLRDAWSAGPIDPEALARGAGLETQQARLVGPPAAGFEPTAPGFQPTASGFVSRARLGPLAYSRRVEMDAAGALEVTWLPEPLPAADGGWFGTILCLTLLTGRADDRALIVAGPDGRERRMAPADPVSIDDVRRATLEDRFFGFALDLLPSPGARLVAAPVETVQRTEKAFETIYQGTLFLVQWRLGAGAPGGGAARIEAAARGESAARPALRLAFRRS
jgi:alpha-amylase